MNEAPGQAETRNVDRRRFLGASLGACALAPLITPRFFNSQGTAVVL